MRRFMCVLGVSAMLSVASSAGAGVISQYEAGSSQIITVEDMLVFDTLMTFDDLSNYSEAGLFVRTNDFAFEDWFPPGFNGTPFYYANGGVNELYDITRVDGGDFDSIDMQVSNGWANADTTFMWIQVYNDGALVAEFDVDAGTGNYVGITGGGFDQVKVGSYFDAATRDQHNPANINALAIDNMTYGIIPAPGAIALMGLAGLVTRRRRR